MAIQLIGAQNHRLNRAESFDSASAYTAAGWVYLEGTGGGLFGMSEAENNQQSSDQIRQNDSGNTTNLVLRSFSGTGSTLGTTEALPAVVGGAWYHAAIVRESATSLKMYIDGTQVAQRTDNVSTRDPCAFITFGQSPAGTARLSGRLAGWKLWGGRALTGAEIAAEAPYRNPQQYLSDVWAVYKFLDNATQLADSSGNSRSLTFVGSGSTSSVADPAGILGDDPAPSSARFRPYFITG